MGPVRVILRLVSLTLLTAVLFLGWLTTRLSALVSASAAARTHRFFLSTWSRLSMAILGVRLHVRGTPPRPPFFYASNHLSYLDIIVLMSQLDATFLSKKEVAGWPVLGFLARCVGTLFIDRTRKSDLVRVIAEVRTRLDRGQGVIVFPEGTSTDGSEVRSFRPSIFEVPLQAGLPIHYGSLSYETPVGCVPANLSVCWWGDMTFGAHFLSLLSLPRIEAWLTFGGEPITAEDRKTMAVDSQRAIARQFRPVVGSLSPHGQPLESHP